MENITGTNTHKLLGLVSLYHPDLHEAVGNIMRYLPYLDRLIIWDNSPLECNLQKQMMPTFEKDREKIEWRGDGENHFIAAAVNYAWQYAEAHNYDLLLLMDQDSQWEGFPAFRKQVELCFLENPNRVFCPYVFGNDTFTITDDIQEKKVFINSGTVIPVHILHAVGGADEQFPLDALDYDLACRILNAGYTIVSLTKHQLHHTVGNVLRMGAFHILTCNYSAERIYSIARSHVLYLRKHGKSLSLSENWHIIKEHYIMMPMRVLLADPQKCKRLRCFFSGIYDGLTYKLS